MFFKITLKNKIRQNRIILSAGMVGGGWDAPRLGLG